MRINKEYREIIRKKYNGYCAYSGTLLKNNWQIDHIVPKYRYECGIVKGNCNNIKNLIPCQGIINHYKRGRDLKEFRQYILTLHLRLKKLPKKTKVIKTINRKKYLYEVANYFNITEDKPFDGIFYFERPV